MQFHSKIRITLSHLILDALYNVNFMQIFFKSFSTANLPTSLSKSQVSSVRKNLKVFFIKKMKFHFTIQNLAIHLFYSNGNRYTDILITVRKIKESIEPKSSARLKLWFQTSTELKLGLFEVNIKCFSTEGSQPSSHHLHKSVFLVKNY